MELRRETVLQPLTDAGAEMGNAEFGNFAQLVKIRSHEKWFTVRIHVQQGR